MMKDAIGGYFSLELKDMQPFHKAENSLSLNTGRNCLEYLLEVNDYKLVYIPYFTCDVILEPFKKLSIPYQFYSIDENLEPIFDFDSLEENEAFLYTNYFGLKDDYVELITSRYSNIIIDNAQSFYSMPQNGADTFYSPRKFFGLPDGGYVYSNKKLDIDLVEDQTSIDRMGHLLKRLAFDAETGYEDFRSNDESLNDQSILKMSQITKKLLASIDYDIVKRRRTENFGFIHNELSKSNKLASLIEKAEIIAPLVYPYWVKNGTELRAKLQRNRIFTPIYWSNVLTSCDKDSIEFDFAINIVHLPIDQRYDKRELKFISEYIYE